MLYIGLIIAIFLRSKNTYSRGFAKDNLFISDGLVFNRYRNSLEMDIKSWFRNQKMYLKIGGLKILLLTGW